MYPSFEYIGKLYPLAETINLAEIDCLNALRKYCDEYGAILLKQVEARPDLKGALDAKSKATYSPLCIAFNKIQETIYDDYTNALDEASAASENQIKSAEQYMKACTGLTLYFDLYTRMLTDETTGQLVDPNELKSLVAKPDNANELISLCEEIGANAIANTLRSESYVAPTPRVLH